MQKSTRKTGHWYALGAYIFWGLFPFYWKVLGSVPAIQVLGHRIVWSFITLLGILLVTRRIKSLIPAINGRILLIYSAAALLIGVNWLTYVWAVQKGMVIETSLGYFINPLLSVVLGVIFFRERLRPLQWIPVVLAGLSVVYLTFTYGTLPWIALTLAVTFAFYGVVKKGAPLGAFNGLTLETGILFLPALILLVTAEITGRGAFLHTGTILNILMVTAGIVTVFPLLLFARAVTTTALTVIGILQYINPTIQFILGVAVFKEPFELRKLVAFALVWLALILFALESTLFTKNQARSARQVTLE